MKKLFLAVLILSVMAGYAFAALEPGVELPASVVQTKMQSVDETQVSIADIKGEKGTLVIFSCNHCPWVKAWESRIAETGNGLQAKGIGVIMINSNDPAVFPEDSLEVMKQRTEEIGFGFPYVVDATSQVAKTFGAKRTPEFFLFNTAGTLVYTGALDDNAENPGAVPGRRIALRLEV